MPIDMSGNTKAPPRKAGRPRAASAPGKRDARLEAVNGLFQLGQFGCVMAGQHADAAAIGMHGPHISEEIVKLSDVNESIRKAVDYMLTVGPYGGLVTACLPLVLQILANHKRIPAQGIPGVHSPEVLAAQFQAEQQQAALLLAQQAQEAQAESARIQSEMAQNGQARQTVPEGAYGDSEPA